VSSSSRPRPPENRHRLLDRKHNHPNRPSNQPAAITGLAIAGLAMAAPTGPAAATLTAAQLALAGLAVLLVVGPHRQFERGLLADA
jgi:hypothetical protein